MNSMLIPFPEIAVVIAVAFLLGFFLGVATAHHERHGQRWRQGG